MWPDLKRAKRNIVNIENEVNRLFKEQRGLYKKEIAKQRLQLLDQVDETIEEVKEEYTELLENLRAHRKRVESKSTFLNRHHDML